MTNAPRQGRADARNGRIAGAYLILCVGVLVLVSCRSRPAPEVSTPTQENDAPVAINSESPFQYPAEPYDQGVEGEVRLRLYVDESGRVRPDSIRVASSSGSPALDSAAVRGAALLRFAPAHKNGQAIGQAFYQPVIFRRGAERSAQSAP